MADEQVLKVRVDFAPIVPSAEAMKAAVTDALAGQTINRRLPSFRMEYREPADRTIRRWMPAAYMEAARASRGVDVLEVAKAVEAERMGDFGEFTRFCARTLRIPVSPSLLAMADAIARVPLLWPRTRKAMCIDNAAFAAWTERMMCLAPDEKPNEFDARAEAVVAQMEQPEPEDGAWLITPADLRETFNGKGIGSGEQSGWGGYEDE